MEREGIERYYAARERGDIAFLLAGLKDPDYRFLATELLSDLKSQEAIQPLRILLQTNAIPARNRAIEALGDLRATEAFDDLVEIASSEAHSSSRTRAINALAKIGDPRAVPTLIELLDDSVRNVRWCAVGALAKLNDPRAIPALAQARKREKASQLRLRRKYAKAIRTLSHS